MEREELLDHQKKFRKQAECSYSFAKYECNKYSTIVSHDKILSNMVETLRN